MGVEQSSILGSSEHRSSIESADDIPYTSYSVGRPIGGDSPKKELKKQASPQSKGRRILPQDIVVVAEGTRDVDDPENDAELVAMQALPTFLPIMRGALNVPSMRDPDVLDKIDYRQVLLLCMRYQDHLRQTADAVAFDQGSLTTRIREIDFAISTLSKMVEERQKKYAKYAEQLDKVQELNKILTKLRSTVHESLPLMDELNRMLPESERLEPFVLNPPPDTLTG